MEPTLAPEVLLALAAAPVTEVQGQAAELRVSAAAAMAALAAEVLVLVPAALAALAAARLLALVRVVLARAVIVLDLEAPLEVLQTKYSSIEESHQPLDVYLQKQNTSFFYFDN